MEQWGNSRKGYLERINGVIQVIISLSSWHLSQQNNGIVETGHDWERKEISNGNQQGFVENSLPDSLLSLSHQMWLIGITASAERTSGGCWHFDGETRRMRTRHALNQKPAGRCENLPSNRNHWVSVFPRGPAGITSQSQDIYWLNPYPCPQLNVKMAIFRTAVNKARWCRGIQNLYKCRL